MNKMQLPSVIFGTSTLGNLYVEKSDEVKQDLLSEYLANVVGPGKPCFDTAGKYGAGLALENLGNYLRKFNIKQEEVQISNKLGWYRVPLTKSEPTFEKEVWKNLEYDAVQKISYNGILECHEQGNRLLGGYRTRIVSVHDPDEYLKEAKDDEDEKSRYKNILDAYTALADLKMQGKVDFIGIGAKDWRIIKRISKDVNLDWVMIANSMTVHSHPAELIQLMVELKEKGVIIINSAVFNAGFLTGGDSYNYKPVNRENEEGKALYQWRARFYQICSQHDVSPATACVQFGLAAPGVTSIALNTSDPKRVSSNFGLLGADVPAGFWQQLAEENLIAPHGLELVLKKEKI